MGYQDIHKRLRQVPFLPFRVTLTDGRTYDVPHPDLAMLGFSSLIVGTPRLGTQDVIFDRTVEISLSRIMQTETIASAATPGGTP